MTDILYDIEGSHLSSVSTLPPNFQSSKCLLLTVTLSSPGVAEPYSMKDTMRNARNTTPFWVAVLQQFCRDDGLVLYICAVSPEENQPLYLKLRRKGVKKG
ncbi:hypothetical protein AOLI_G00307060 [Acnodon oligacanthus]